MEYKSRIGIFSMVVKDILLNADTRGELVQKRGPLYGSEVQSGCQFPLPKSRAPVTSLITIRKNLLYI